MARAARSWSASHVSGSKFLAIGQERGHGAHDLGWLVEPAEELIGVEAGARLEGLPATVDEDEAGTEVAKLERGRRCDDRPESMSGEHDPDSIRQHAGAIRDRDSVGHLDRQLVRAVLGRGVGETVAAQVHGHEALPSRGRAEATGDRRPDPARLRETVDRQYPGRRGRLGRFGRSAPVQEMDPIAGRRHDHETRWLDGSRRVGHPGGWRWRGRRGIHRP